MEINIFVSIIMPVKNAEKYIKQCIDSVLNQTYKNFELIIIDDSEDKTSNIINNYSDERIKHIMFNGNISRALNLGISAANGMYIMRMDSDDFCSPGRLETQIKVLQTKKFDVVGCNLNYVDKLGNILLKKVFPENDEDIKFYMPINVTLPHPTMLTYKDIFLKVGLYDESMSKVEDLDIFLRMISMGLKFYNVQESLYSYRIKRDLWDINSENNLISYKISSDFINTLLLDVYDKNYSDNLLRKALLEYYKGDMNVARKYFKKFLALNPQENTDLLRYLVLSVFPGNGMKILRKYKVPQIINYFIHKIFKKDMQYQKISQYSKL